MAGGVRMKISATTLGGPVVILEPLRRRHLPGLARATQGTPMATPATRKPNGAPSYLRLTAII